MSKFFCVFWYPTIFHREKKHRDVGFFDKKGRQPIKQSIADIDEKKDVKELLQKDLFLQIEEIPCKKGKRDDEKCFDLVFTLKGKDKDEKKIETTFHHYDHSRNGFVIYWYDRDQLLNDFWNSFLAKENIGETIDALRNIFSNRIKERYPIVLEKPLSDECVKNHTIDWLLISFYHLAKSFYHEHEVHDEADAKLESYYYKKIDSDGHRVYLTEPPSLSTKNNPVINRYLDQYEQMFINYAERVSKDYRDRKADIDEFLIQRRDILEALNHKVPKKSDISNLITLLGSTFKKIKPIDSKANQQSSNDAMESSVCGERPLPGEDNTPLPSPDDLIKENRPSSDKDVEALKKELKEKVIEVYLPLVNHLYKQVSSLSKICHDALIEYTYCRTLLGSKYNDDYKYDSLFTQSEVEYLSDNPFQYSRPSIRDTRRKKAFNIRNSIRYIEDIRQKCFLLESTLTKILIEEVHGISKDNTDILSQINNLTNGNSDILYKINNLTQGNTDILSELKGLTKENSDILYKINNLTNGNSDILYKINNLIQGNTDILSELKGLTKENSKILSQVKILEQKNANTLRESKKSNRMSYALGLLSVGLGLISVTPNGSDYCWIKILGVLCFVPAVGFAISTLWISEEDNTEDSPS